MGLIMNLARLNNKTMRTISFYNLNIIKRFCSVTVLWDWYDFGIVFKVYRNSKHANYYISIDIQIAWLDLWLQFIRK